MKKSDILKKAEFTLKKELEALSSVRKLLNKDFLKAVELLDGIKGRIVVSGIGKSGQIGAKIASSMISLGIPAVFLNPAEAAHGDLGVVGNDDAVIAISASGETKELLRIIKHVRRHLKIPVITITGNARAAIGSLSDASLAFKIRDEGSPYNLAPMASATATLVIGDMLASALSAKKGLTARDFADAHPGGSLGLRLSKVKELLSQKPLPAVKKRETFARTLKIMSADGRGVAAVVDERKKLSGVITDGDIRRFLLSGGFSDKAVAGDVMTARPKTIGEDESLEAALKKMEHYKITSLFVTNRHGGLRGLIRMLDIVEHKML